MTQQSSNLLDEINRHQWYQSIPLANGVVTPGETGDATQNKLEMMRLPESLAGKSVLDVGCNEGFFAFECERRGASRIVAIDKGKAAQEKFHLVKEIVGSAVEFHALDLLDFDRKRFGRFDIVFFLAVLHHVRYPFMVLDRIFDLTQERAIIEYVEAVPEPKAEVSALIRRLSKKGHLHMLPTRTLMLESLERCGFKETEILGTHRAKSAGPHRKMPGYSQQRVLLQASR